MTTPRRPLRLFAGVGIEVEYAIVDRESLAVRPIADHVLRDDVGDATEEVERDGVCWSNELTAHVVELKTRGPSPSVETAWPLFVRDVRELNERLAPEGAQLMPTAMHPLMNPAKETRLWPHGESEIYETYDRIFGCRGHGFANVQSVHLNLPFSGEAEFARLHAAVRVVLPLLPVIAASSPIVEGHVTRRMDTRLTHYRRNQRAVPIVTGRVIPEPLYTRAAYEREIFEPIEKALRPLDPDGILEPEWTNSRGAIARFSRGSIEIRLLDVQECPRMDLAIAGLVVALVRALVDERTSTFDEQKAWSIDRLGPLLTEAETHGSDASFGDARYAALFGERPVASRALALVERIAARFAPGWATPALGHIIEHGALSSRILAATGLAPSASRIVEVYQRLCHCLQEDTWFSP